MSLRMLHVIPDLRKGGAERIAIDICNEFIRKGHEVQLLTFRQDNHYSFLSKKIPIRVVPARFVPSIGRKPLKEVGAYQRAIEEFRPQIIHSHLFEAEMVTRQVILPGIRYITHLHSTFEQLEKFSWKTLSNKAWTTNYFERRLMLRQYRKCSNNFIAISNHTANFFRRVLPLDLQRVEVIYNAIDYKRFYKSEQSKLSADGIKLISIGSLGPRKNHLFLVKVMAQLRDAGIAAHLTILGEGKLRKEIESAIHAAGLQEKIALAGNVENVENYLHRSDIYVHSAAYEPFGLVLVEAMAAGLPCVMLDAMGNRDLAEEGKNSFLIRQGDVNGFAEAVKKLIEDPALYAGMSEYAKEYAKRFDIAPYTDKLLQFYEQCAVSPA